MEEQNIITKEEIYHIERKYHIRMGAFFIRKDGLVDINGDVNISNTKLQQLPLKFGKIYGDFYCHSNKLTTLENAPYYVGGNFCCHSNKLTSLEFGPKEVEGFYACHLNNLKSLTGAPKNINGSFNCFSNKLTSLINGPSKVGGNYYTFNNELISLEGSPDYIGGSFIVNANRLTNLVGCPKEIGNIFSFDNTVTSLYMGNQNCKVNRIEIQSPKRIPESKNVLPLIVFAKQSHLPLVFKYLSYLNIFTPQGIFNESNFNDIISDIEEGLH